tara:strand:- start:1364 stop:3559 length:2196 start_codon:yes stop_codon:yes gene_type:complete
MDEKFLKPYSPKETEDNIYKLWEESGFFNPDVCIKEGITDKDARPFSIVLPPPNVTGRLHLGHAFEDALQDAFVRFARMRGKKTLWIPGTDSAAIATQARVEKEIYKKEKKTRHDLGREEIVSRVEKFAKENEETMLNQIKKMGASLDWSRYAYTLDEKRNAAVSEAFVQMYDAGLIYRGNRIINWDPKGQTTISDDEVVHEERDGMFFTFRYWKDFPIPISTSRPETKVGDTAVAVNPEDKRYKEFVGKTFTGEFAGTTLSIRIVADDVVDKEFGTGAVGVTPAHSHTDWEIADRHDLPRPQVINEYAKMNETAGSLVGGLKTLEAREKIIEWLRENTLLEKEEKIKQNISLSERTGGIVEPLPKLQWFVNVNKPFKIPHSKISGIKAGEEITLKELMHKAVSEGNIEILPARFEKSYNHWIDNLHDWCISRQIWFGHRIPAWHKSKGATEEIHVGINAPEESGWSQEEDVLDTWFSSALWTFSTLGWPEETDDLKTYHPTTLMLPGYEILFLWVSRMVLMSGFHLGELPFKNVILHGIVRDRQGRKFSKSLGNGIDPLEIIEKYGADALRMGLIVGAAPGNDVKFDEQKIKGYKHFTNKIWNISRFVLENTKDVNMDAEYVKEDRVIRERFDVVLKEVTKDIERYRLDLAAETLYHYTWHTFADTILEHSKAIFEDEPENVESRKKLLISILADLLKLLHPFMPFITEEVWSLLPRKDSELLMVSKWPE